MGKNMGVFQTLDHDTVNGWQGHMTSPVTKHIIKEKNHQRWWRKKQTNLCLNQTCAVLYVHDKARKQATHGAEKRRKRDRLCDRRCNAKQCTVLWMGRQVLYEWKGSCDRSTSRSRYFSLTVNKRTQGISPLKQDQNATPKNGRDVHESTPRTDCADRHPWVDGGRGVSGVRVTPFFKRFFFFFFFYEWGLWYVNECDWEKKMASSAFATPTLPQSARCGFCFVWVCFS